MKKTFIILSFLSSISIFAQRGIFEGGYEMNFLNQKDKSIDLSGHNYNFGLGITGSSFPWYGMLTYSRMTIQDEQIQSNKIEDNLGGVTLGIRPFAKSWYSRFQPVIQVSARTNFKSNNDHEEIVKPRFQVYEGSAGFEFYVSSKISLVALGSYQQWKVGEGTLQNYSGKLSLRIVFPND